MSKITKVWVGNLPRDVAYSTNNDLLGNPRQTRRMKTVSDQDHLHLLVARARITVARLLVLRGRRFLIFSVIMLSFVM